MPKLLDFLKEKGLSHADAIDFIEKNYSKPDDETETSDEPDTSDEQNDKPDPETELSDEDESGDEGEEEKLKVLVKKLADEEEAKIDAKAKSDKAKIAKMVQEELKKRGKIDRRTPSKGKVTDIPKLDYDINIKGYEVKTIRTKK